MELTITPQQQRMIDEATAHLPEGFNIYSRAQVDELIRLKNNFQADSDSLELAKKIFRKVKPVFELFGGKEGMGLQGLMQAVMGDPKIMKTITDLGKDEELKKDFQTIAQIL